MRCVPLLVVFVSVFCWTAARASTEGPTDRLEALVRSASDGIHPSATALNAPEIAAWVERYRATLEDGSPAGFGPAPAWGYILETHPPAGEVRHLFLHIFRPPASDSISLPVKAGAVRACHALTEACAPIPFRDNAEGGIIIPLPKTRDPLDTVIALDVAP